MTGGGGRYLPRSLEELPDEAVGRPVCEADLTAGFADTQQLGRGLFLVWREHHAERRDDSIKRLVRKGQRFGIGHLELDWQAFRHGAGTSALQQTAHVIGRRDVAPAPRGRQAGHSVAGSHVEHFLACPEVESLAKLLAYDLQGRAHHSIVTGGPCCLLAGLNGHEFGGSGRRGLLGRLFRG